MKAVLMAGGFGTRIQPLTNSIPKPMLPIVNVPMMEHILNRLKHSGIEEIVILLYFKPEVIKNHFKDGSKWGVKITYVLPDDDYGTAGAVGYAREYLDTTFLIVSGDLVTDFDFEKMIDFHTKNASKLTITLTPVEDPLQFGVVITDKEGKIERFLEKPSWGEVFSDTINTGIYLIEPEILRYIPSNVSYDFSKDLFPKLMEEGITLWGCTLQGYWRDVGNPDSYREVHHDILSGSVVYDIPGQSIQKESGTLYLDQEVSLPESVVIKGRVVIGRGSVISEGVELKDCVIGANCSIAKESVIEDSVLWDRVSIGAVSQIHNSVICNDTLIEEACRIEEGAIIAEYCQIGPKVKVIKDVTIWPHKTIEKRAIVSSNIVWGEQYKSSIFHKGKVIGSANVELTGEMAVKIAEAFGTILQEGSTVYVSRDYHPSSRMLKRFILGGLLSTGINCVDIQAIPSNVMRHELFKNQAIAAGIHVRHSVSHMNKTEIVFFTHEGMLIDTNLAKSIERIFFREQFRRVNPSRVGKVREAHNMKLAYKQDIRKLIAKEFFVGSGFKIAANMLHGMVSDIYPELLDTLKIENIMINDYASASKLTRITASNQDEAKKELSDIVRALHLTVGILLYPNGQRLDIVDDRGEIVSRERVLMALLYMLHLHDTKSYKIYLPAWAPDIMDHKFTDIEITRGRLMGMRTEFLGQFDLIADVDAHYAFTEFGYHSDAIYASLKILEFMALHQISFSDLLRKIDPFYYRALSISCPSSQKGRVMRRFMEEGKAYRLSHLDGIKIIFADHEWILMIPDDHEELVHLYIQAVDSKRGEEIKKEYISKLEKWIERDKK
ncbi:MAG: mannose-1-phosphate guanyltransferase [Campylobacteraceae bacterium 4484_4]|nr:MAG: mannose-1-phosphate guanyltransferase [Campylobacteraceae bacterium 4484_4]